MSITRSATSFYFGGVTTEWQHHIAEVIVAAEKGSRNKHLISQNIANCSAKIQNPHPAVSVFNFHYASPPITVAMNYGLNKVIGDNETGFRGTSDLPHGWRRGSSSWPEAGFSIISTIPSRPNMRTERALIRPPNRAAATRFFAAK